MPDSRSVIQTPFRFFTFEVSMSSSGEKRWLARVPPFVSQTSVGSLVSSSALRADTVAGHELPVSRIAKSHTAAAADSTRITPATIPSVDASRPPSASIPACLPPPRDG